MSSPGWHHRDFEIIKENGEMNFNNALNHFDL